MTEQTPNSKYELFNYMDLFVEEGYPLLIDSFATVDAEEGAGESHKAATAEQIGQDLWEFFGCGCCLIWLDAHLKDEDMAVKDEINAVNRNAALEVYPDMADGLGNFYEFLWDNEGRDKEIAEETLEEYLTLWLATNFYDKEDDNADFTEDELDVAYAAAGTFNDFVKQVLLIQQDVFGPYVKESVNNAMLSGLFDIDDANNVLN